MSSPTAVYLKKRSRLLNLIFRFCECFRQDVIFLPPATKLREGNVFTPVCHSVHIISRGLSVREPPPPKSLSEGGLCQVIYGNVRTVRILLERILVFTFKRKV